jgi:hypothetical protein
MLSGFAFKSSRGISFLPLLLSSSISRTGSGWQGQLEETLREIFPAENILKLLAENIFIAKMTWMS